jgi:peptidyl-prolyl cis-trans isomerase D
MLQRIGDSLKGQKWLAYLVLGALALVFAAWGAYGVVNLSFGGSNYAAEADGSKISLEEARNAWLRQQTQWQQRLGGADIPLELRNKLQDQVLEGLISRALLTQRTRDLGYRVSQDALRAAVQSEPAFQVGGQYSPEAAKAALAQAGVSLQAYEDDLRTSVQRVQLRAGVLPGSPGAIHDARVGAPAVRGVAAGGAGGAAVGERCGSARCL